MSDINRDPELDRQQPDPRSAPEQVTGAHSEAAEATDGSKPAIPLEPDGTAATQSDQETPAR